MNINEIADRIYCDFKFGNISPVYCNSVYARFIAGPHEIEFFIDVDELDYIEWIDIDGVVYDFLVDPDMDSENIPMLIQRSIGDDRWLELEDIILPLCGW